MNKSEFMIMHTQTLFTYYGHVQEIVKFRKKNLQHFISLNPTIIRK